MKINLGFLKETDPIKKKNNRYLATGCAIGAASACAIYGDFEASIFFLIIVFIFGIEEKRIESKERLGKK